MTSKIKDTAPNGCSTIVRALINPLSPTLLVHERVAQRLQLQRSNKNARVEELEEPKHLHKDLYGSRCLALRTMRKKSGWPRLKLIFVATA